MNKAEARQYFRELGADTRFSPQDRKFRQEYIAAEARSDSFQQARTTLRDRDVRVSAAQTYFKNLQSELTGVDGKFRKGYLAEERKTGAFKQSRAALRVFSRETHKQRIANGEPLPQRIDRSLTINTEKPFEKEKTETLASPRIERENSLKATEDILWAREALEAYAGLPEGKARKEAFEAFAQSHLVDLWKDPARLKTAFEVWKAQSEESRLFFSGKERIEREIKHHWKEVNPEQLMSYVGINARGGYVADEVGDVLKSYFAGPRERREKVEAFHNFTYAVLDSIEDKETAAHGSKIALHETDILPRQDGYVFDIYITAMLDFADRPTRAKALIANSLAIPTLAYVAGIDPEEIRMKNIQELDRLLDQPGYSKTYRSMMRQARHNGNGEFVKLVREAREETEGYDTMMSFVRANQGEPSIKIAQSFIDSCPEMLDSPLVNLIDERVGRRALGAVDNLMKVKYLAELGESATTLTIRLPDDSRVIDIAIPGSQIQNRREIIAHFMEKSREVDSAELEEHEIVLDELEIGDSVALASYREADLSEKERHKVEVLNGFGFPAVAVEDVAAANTALATQIELYQRRFMNERGIRVPIYHAALTELGYQHIDFKKDADDPEKTKVTIQVNDMDVDIKLDRDFRFDFEGRYADISGIHDSLHNVLLGLLYPALCEEHTKDQNGENVEIGSAMVSRVGHLRLLPEGQKFSGDQVKAMLDFEGKDLSTISERRKAELQTTRNTTYVKPKFSDEPNQLPVTLHIGIPTEKFAVLPQKEVQQQMNEQIIYEAEDWDQEPNVFDDGTIMGAEQTRPKNQEGPGTEMTK